ncbi:MAG: molybdate ABC transporter permease subunit [Minwuia sp.]|uniref:molybdate ABC transporter permease subunit n=1 Tax=Minwuia sp. TaxID=2493630 RepID=UPI003A8BB2DA
MIMHPLETAALLLSLKVSVVAVLFILPPGIAAGWLLARREFRGKALFDGLVHLPLVVPPVVIGYVLLYLFSPAGPLGGPIRDLTGLTVAFTWQGAALAAAIVAFPLLVRSVRLSVEAADPRLEQAARTLGKGPWQVFWRITLPLSAPGVLAGAVLAFARCLSEFGATITFVANLPGETRTIPIAIYSVLQTPGGEAAATRLSVLAVLLALVALLISEWLARRMRRQIGLADA